MEVFSSPSKNKCSFAILSQAKDFVNGAETFCFSAFSLLTAAQALGDECFRLKSPPKENLRENPRRKAKMSMLEASFLL